MSGDFEVPQVDRRSVLKKVGAGAAVVWAAPVVTSFGARAAAGTPAACERGFICFQTDPIRCGPGDSCLCTDTVTGPECLSSLCENTVPPCSTNEECEARIGPGGRCQPAGTGCCGNTCIYPCGVAPKASPDARRNNG